ncbi:hypothetical protein [Leifsonia sp. fls2-241-R2A-40a]|uniref:hypothetical protein n=1 Tax=Leifsonia sp. fls2-241-R2A-40a TaxID=3040290 RepID=UPI00254A3E90|nr:hypothetical protein [Leifsonia sp. fls2-241-R2A-40a]
MAKQKKLEKAAEKALKRAEDAVADAITAVKRLDKKKAKKRAHALRKQVARLGSDKPAAPEGKADADPATVPDLTPPLPSVRDDQVDTAAEFAGSAATTAPHDPELDQLTVQALRDAARARGLRNVSKLSKGQLIERLSE